MGDHEEVTQEKTSTGNKATFALMAIFCLTILIASVMMGVRGTDNTCNTNEKQVDTSIEVRNYKPAKRAGAKKNAEPVPTQTAYSEPTPKRQSTTSQQASNGATWAPKNGYKKS